ERGVDALELFVRQRVGGAAALDLGQALVVAALERLEGGHEVGEGRLAGRPRRRLDLEAFGGLAHARFPLRSEMAARSDPSRRALGSGVCLPGAIRAPAIIGKVTMEISHRSISWMRLWPPRSRVARTVRKPMESPS